MESGADNDNKWLDRDEINSSGEEIVLIDFVCIRKQLGSSSKNVADEGEECGVDITNKRIRVYENTDFNHVKRKIKLSKLTKIFINSRHSQVLLNTSKSSTRVLLTKKAEEIVKIILAVRRQTLSSMTFYEVPVKDLTKKPSLIDDPADDWIVRFGANRDSEFTDGIDEEAETQKVYKGVAKPESIKREPDIETTTNGDFDNEHHPLEESKDYASNNSQELHFDSDDSDIERGNNECMLTKESLTKFSLLKVIGKGAFGRVFLAKKDTGEVFAMKRIRKDKVLRSNAVENILLERKILSEVKHPLLLSIKHVFASKYRFYFFCDYIVGGDLMRHLTNKPNGFNIAELKFIASQLVLALECLHENKIVHRDIKPENVLIDDEGYIRLADFGLAKDLSEQAGRGF